MNRLLAAAVLSAGAAVTACGGSSSAPSSPSSSASPTAATSASSTADQSPAAYVLTTDELPAGGQAWTVSVDGELNGEAATHQRVWQNSDSSQGLEIDVVLEASMAAATADWSTWRDGIQAKIIATSQPACPSSMPATCVEGVGATSDGQDEVRITWQNGVILAAVVGEQSSGTGVDQAYAESVAAAEDQKISSLLPST